MKTAIVIIDAMTQIVLTPETEFEKIALEAIEKKKDKVKIMTGSFYECYGGWVRSGNGDESIILKIEGKA